MAHIMIVRICTYLCVYVTRNRILKYIVLDCGTYSVYLYHCSHNTYLSHHMKWGQCLWLSCIEKLWFIPFNHDGGIQCIPPPPSEVDVLLNSNLSRHPFLGQVVNLDLLLSVLCSVVSLHRIRNMLFCTYVTFLLRDLRLEIHLELS